MLRRVWDYPTPGGGLRSRIAEMRAREARYRISSQHTTLTPVTRNFQGSLVISPRGREPQSDKYRKGATTFDRAERTNDVSTHACLGSRVGGVRPALLVVVRGGQLSAFPPKTVLKHPRPQGLKPPLDVGGGSQPEMGKRTYVSDTHTFRGARQGGLTALTPSHGGLCLLAG